MRAIAALAMLALAGCAAPPGGGDPAGPGAEAWPERDADAGAVAGAGVVSVRLGETARLGDLRVRPIRVIEDSRCPGDVTCVWAGRLRLRVAISGVPGETELILGQLFALPGPSAGTLTLVAADPAPWHRPPAGVETGPATRFGFRRD